MTGIRRQGAEIATAWGFPFSYGSQNATKVTFSGTSTSAASLDAQGTYLLVATEDCYVKFGASGMTAASATSYHFWLPARVPFVLSLPYTGDSDTIYHRVIQDTTGGNLHITQMSAE